MNLNTTPARDSFASMNLRTFKSPSFPGSTPWGAAQQKTEVAPGIWHVSTAGHGGYWISSERRRAMPPSLRDALTFAGGNWYEEDCDWSIVVAAFPDCFPAAAYDAALDTLKRWRKAIYAATYPTVKE